MISDQGTERLKISLLLHNLRPHLHPGELWEFALIMPCRASSILTTPSSSLLWTYPAAQLSISFLDFPIRVWPLIFNVYNFLAPFFRYSCWTHGQITLTQSLQLKCFDIQTLFNVSNPLSYIIIICWVFFSSGNASLWSVAVWPAFYRFLGLYRLSFCHHHLRKSFYDSLKQLNHLPAALIISFISVFTAS